MGEETYTTMKLKVQLPSPSRKCLATIALPAEVIEEVDRTADFDSGHTGVGATK